MTKLVWNDPENKRYHYGVDRGVLYIPDEFGLYTIARPWNGLKSVTEETDSLEVKPYYLDGVKYADVKRPGDYKGKLVAYTYPDEFLPYDGYSELYDGFIATNQPSNDYFGLSYRTMIGNETEGQRFGYKIHILYNLTASLDSLSYSTLRSDMEPIDFSWDLSAVPVRYSGIRPTAHFIIDTTKVERSIVGLIEDALYGNEELDPKLPTLDEIYTIMNDRIYEPLSEPI